MTKLFAVLLLLCPALLAQSTTYFARPAAAGGASIAWTHKDAGNSASASITTASVSFTAGSRAIITLGLSCTGGTAAGADDNLVITGGGTTWTQIGETQFGTRRALFVMISDATPTSGTINIAWDNNGTDGVWEQGTYSIDEVTCNTTTRFSNVATGSGVNTTGSVTIGGTVDSGDHTAFLIAHATSEAVTLEAGLTGLHAATGLTGLRTFNFAYDGTPTIDQTPSASWATSDSWGAIGFIVEKP
jgi:hypothetical protein